MRLRKKKILRGEARSKNLAFQTCIGKARDRVPEKRRKDAAVIKKEEGAQSGEGGQRKSSWN